MDSYKIFEMVMEKYPGKDPNEILEIVEKFRRELAIIENNALNRVSERVIDAEYSEVKALENRPQEPADRMAFLKEKYKGKWTVSPKKCIKDDEILCAICGKSYKRLPSSHLAKHDGMTADEYKELCGYDKKTSLMANNILQASQERMKKGGASYEARQKTLSEKMVDKKEAEDS
jgi:predicted transcriptional regulator